MLMKQNVNNDVTKDSLIIEYVCQVWCRSLPVYLASQLESAERNPEPYVSSIQTMIITKQKERQI